MFGQIFLLARIALRNIFATKLNVFIGLIIFGGVVLVVVGGSLLDSLDNGMSRSVTSSMSGHIQVYSSESKDDLSIFGEMGGSDSDLEEIEDFSKTEKTLLSVPNVKTVVPMGIKVAFVFSGNVIDLTLERLRQAINKKLKGDASPELAEQIESQKKHVQQMVTVLQEDRKNLEKIAEAKAVDAETTAAIQRASSAEFWAEFDKDPLNSLEFLENQIAPQISDGDLLFLRYMGTDLEKFQSSFDRFKILQGETVPKGHRGFLFSSFFYEEFFKLKTARRLDRIKEEIEVGGKQIATDPELQRWVKENQTQTREVLLQLDSLKTRSAVERLQQSLGSKKEDLAQLLEELFTLTDENFSARYKIFYDQVAPLLELYRVRIGDMLTIKAFTKSGYASSVNVKVYGTFEFKGMEGSPLAGASNLMDLATFRDLYGYLNAEKVAELKAIKDASGSKDVPRENAEDMLFGGDATVVSDAKVAQINDQAELQGNDPPGGSHREEAANKVYTQEEIDEGVFLNAAVILKDPDKVKETIAEIQKAAERDGQKLKVVTWQQAAGLFGQFITLAKLVLYIAVFIIFIVALVIINNAMMMATLQRVQEIGTLRAIGAQRNFVLGMVLFETTALGLVFGASGALAGGGIVKWLGTVGIPAKSRELYMFFSGPRLFPTLGASVLIAAFAIVVVVSVISTLYPAFVATRVSPLQAMQAEE